MCCLATTVYSTAELEFLVEKYSFFKHLIITDKTKNE